MEWALLENFRLYKVFKLDNDFPYLNAMKVGLYNIWKPLDMVNLM